MLLSQVRSTRLNWLTASLAGSLTACSFCAGGALSSGTGESGGGSTGASSLPDAADTSSALGADELSAGFASASGVDSLESASFFELKP